MSHSFDSAVLRTQQPVACEVPPDVRADLARSNRTMVADDIIVMRCWPIATACGIRMVGRCPHCGGVHAHGPSADPLRLPHCPTGLFWRPEVADEHHSVRLVHYNAAPPEDVWREFWSEPSDLLMMAAAALRKGRWTMERSQIAFRAIVQSGVLDERIGALADNVSEHRAWRLALAEFIRSCDGRCMRWRLAAALERAHARALQGEVSERGAWPPPLPGTPVAVGVHGLTAFFRSTDGDVVALKPRQFTEANLYRLAPPTFWSSQFPYPGRRKGFDRRRAASHLVRLAIAAGSYRPELVAA